MPTRKPLVGGNWKMNLHRAEAVALASGVASKFGKPDKADVCVCPAFPYLGDVAAALGKAGGKVGLGAQDFYGEPNGAFTGEVSLSMLKDLCVTTVLAGHSERRHVIGESDVLINRKTRAALDAGFNVILCIGEKLEQREAGMTNAINWGQLGYGLAGVKPEQMGRVVIAYEPVWAIGTGKNATPDDAQKAHEAIRAFITSGLFNKDIGDKVRILYGGSVKASNAKDLFKQPDIDGGLIGGASLKADEFLAIVEAACA